MSNGVRFLNVMNKVAKGKDEAISDIVLGVVLSVSPLIIKLGKLELTTDFLFLSPFCTPSLLWAGLSIGDNVQMLKLSSGQKYYVVQKQGGTI